MGMVGNAELAEHAKKALMVRTVSARPPLPAVVIDWDGETKKRRKKSGEIFQPIN